jgi:hypothetical protein
LDINELIASVLSKDSSVIVGDEQIAPYLSSTECFSRDVLCVVSVGTEDDIAKILKLANQQAVLGACPFSVYPISTGNNWGYGSGLPNQESENTVILDLRRLNKISFFDPENGICTVQPGVTQQDLYTFLTENGDQFMVPVTGAGPNCSVLANAIERGYGITPNTDHFLALTSIRGFLPNGDFYTSALSSLDKSQEQYVDKTFKWKLGPYVEGLYSQSGNLIVTDVTLVLAKKAIGFDSFYMRFYDQKAFASAYYVMKTILSDLGGVVGSINLMDKRRVCAMVAANPQGAGVHSNMTEAQCASIASENDIPEWTLVGTIYTTKRMAEAARHDIKQIAKGQADQLVFSSSWLIRIGRLVSARLKLKGLKSVTHQLNKLDNGMEIMRGKPNNVALPLAYWRNPSVDPQSKQDLSPAADGCGLLWYAPLVPSKQQKMEEFVEFVRCTCRTFNIEPMITFTNLSSYSTDSTIPIVFNVNDNSAVKDAHACLQSLYEKGLNAGFVPYRLNIEQQKYLPKEHISWQTAKAINASLDKNQILSSGRYNP